MEALKVRKNFIFERDTLEQAASVLKQKHKNLTEAITLYFQAIAKEPGLIDTIESVASKRSGSFIGTLDGEIGDESFKEMKKERHELLS